MYRTCVLFVAGACICFWPWSAGNEAGEMKKMKFTMPKLTEEETESNYLPDLLKCDACHAVTYQLIAALRRAEEKTKSKKLLESELLDVLDELCTKGFEEYGLKEINGIHRLSGPGLEAAEEQGMVQMGGKWPRRIRDLCQEHIGEIGESEVYHKFRKDITGLKTFLCRDYCQRQTIKQEL